MDRTEGPVGGRKTGSSPAEGQSAPPHPHWEGGAAEPPGQGCSAWTCRSKKGSHFGALLCHPWVSVSALLIGSSQDPGQGPGEGGQGAVWLCPLLSGHSWRLRLQWPGFVLIYWGGGGLGEKLSGLGGPLA